MSPLEAISQDLDWREAELGSLKLLLSRNDITESQRAVLLRACWALLYAHYEGFAKTALTIFYDEARKRTQSCASLPRATRLFALERRLKQLRALPSPDLLDQVENFTAIHHVSRPVFPDVDTKSNLWPSVLKELLTAADLSLSTLDTHQVLIKTLVSRRNSITHGDNDIIQEISYYRLYESAIYDIMYDLAFSVDDRLSRSPYA